MACVSASVCFGCAYTTAQRYVDFSIDLCLTERFSECFDQVQRGKATVFTRAELDTLKEDIALWQGDYTPADKANGYLTDCADLLLQTIAYQKDGMGGEAEDAVLAAIGLYREAELAIHNIGLEDAYD